MFLFLVNLFFFISGLHTVWNSEIKAQRIRGLIILIAGSIGCFLATYSMGITHACQELTKSLSG